MVKMNLGFYYHIPVCIDENGISLPSYIGVFIEGLASRVTRVYLIAHTHGDIGDYLLQNSNIYVIDLGKKTNSLHRSFFYKKILAPLDPIKFDINCFLIRAPSPLAPAFNLFEKLGIPVIYYLVGDYRESSRLIKYNRLSNILKKLYLNWCHFHLTKVIKDKRVLVNSPALMESIKETANMAKLIPSTTLCAQDFNEMTARDMHSPVKILYTGRFDLNKGLLDLIDATKLLLSTSSVELHLVGWEDNTMKPVETELRKRINDLDIEKYVFFHGKKRVGQELNAMYRQADIYCMPSHHEGFPRTIWEAMANSLPVVATRVGGIPYFLKDGIDASLIEPKSANAIAVALAELITNQELRHRIRENGMIKARANTIENRSDELIRFINEII